VNATDTRVLAGGARLTHSSAMIFLRSTILYSFLLALLACGGDDKSASGPDTTDTTDGDNAADDGSDDGEAPPTGAKDSGVKPSGTKDAAVTPTPSPAKDGGSTPTPTVTKDGGTTASTDGGVDAGKDAGGGGGFMIPDIFGPPADAGSTPPRTDAGGTTGAAGDKSGPCKDLNLFCFDAIDMFLFNADCFTCNGGKGCQGCAIPYAY
jgi:hypothetical protein